MSVGDFLQFPPPAKAPGQLDPPKLQRRLRTNPSSGQGITNMIFLWLYIIKKKRNDCSTCWHLIRDQQKLNMFVSIKTFHNINNEHSWITYVLCVCVCTRALMCCRTMAADAPSVQAADEWSREIDPAGDVRRSLQPPGKSAAPPATHCQLLLHP